MKCFNKFSFLSWWEQKEFVNSGPQVQLVLGVDE